MVARNFRQTFMKKIEAVIQPFKLDDVKEALSAIGTQGLTVHEVIGFFGRRERTEIYRGQEYVIDFLPQVKLEVIVIDELAAQVVQIIEREARTGAEFDGKILVLPIDEAVRIRTGERGASAL